MSKKGDDSFVSQKFILTSSYSIDIYMDFETLYSECLQNIVPKKGFLMAESLDSTVLCEWDHVCYFLCSYSK